jgi:hypothetical protein
MATNQSQPFPAISRLMRFWPVAMLALALVITATWIGFLSFEIYKLAKSTFLQF